MHWLIWKRICHSIPLWKLIKFWKRFIDDIIGLWKGTRRQFSAFVEMLNKKAEQFGIKFGDWQIGKSVNFLDLTLELDNGQIHHRLYKKPTDARLYLRTDSYHPDHVFQSVAFSQMIRIIERNSRDNTCEEDLEELKSDLEKAGHKRNTLEELEPRAVHRAITNIDKDKNPGEDNTADQNLVFSVQFSPDIDALKKVVRELEGDIKKICGDIKIIFAIRKHPSIGNRVVKNKQLGQLPPDASHYSQRCGVPQCQTCSLLFNFDDKILVNGKPVLLDKSANCGTKNIIYIAQCQICSAIPGSEDTYFGQTTTPFRTRINNHRACFPKKDDKDKNRKNAHIVNKNKTIMHEKSALSMHCFLKHTSEFDLKFFKLGIVKSVPLALNLDREESRFCVKYRTNVWGLNRMDIRT